MDISSLRSGSSCAFSVRVDVPARERVREGEVAFVDGGDRASDGEDVVPADSGRLVKARDGDILEKRLSKVVKKRLKPSSAGLDVFGVESSSGIASPGNGGTCLGLCGDRAPPDDGCPSACLYTFPPAFCVDTSGNAGTPCLCCGAGLPRAVARLLTMEDERSRVV